MVSWDESLSVHVNIIDSQHKKFINAINQLQAACEQKRASSEVIKTLDFLQQYCIHHFIDEEQLMFVENYPHLETQKQQHSAFKDKIAQLRKELVSGGVSDSFTSKVNTVIIAWLLDHINRHDKLIGEYINKK